MRRSAPSIITIKCPRCGKSVASMARSITGAEDIRKKYQGICSKCITPQEQNDMLKGQAAAIVSAAQGGK